LNEEHKLVHQRQILTLLPEQDIRDNIPNMTKKLDVFISSKMRELAAERKALQELLPTLDSDLVKLRAWVFEQDAPASNASIREVYLNALKNSALYIGLFWNEYGGWTVDEFERATEWGISRHIYVKDIDPHKREPRLQTFLDRQADVISGITPKWFTTTDELREQVKKSIQVWLQDYLLRRPGDTSAIFADTSDDVPEQPTKLIGRDALLEECRELLEEKSRVLLQGFGGMGKSALAATIAAQWIDDDRGSIVWLRAGTENADTLFEALAHPFDAQQVVASAKGNAKLKAVRSLLAECKATLLVLDDVWDGAALNQVLKAVPRNIAVLVTARQRYAVDEILEVGKLTADDALQLLSHYARQNYTTDPQARQLCRQLGYLAFALEVAGKTLKVDRITPRELLQRIADAPHDIVMPEDFAEEGRTSIKELLDASLNALETDPRQVFLAFGALFVPNATPELLARYMKHDEPQIREALTTLQRRGLAEQEKDSDTNISYYHIHDLAYSYARTIFASQGPSRQPVIEACRGYTLRHENDIEALAAEYDNILGAAQAAHETNSYDDLIEIMKVLIGPYLAARGHNLPFLELLDAAISAAEKAGSQFDEARHFFLSRRGNAHYERGNLNDALECYQRALELARTLDLKDREVILLSVIGKVRSDQGAEDAEQYLEEAYQRASQLQDDFLLGFVLEHRGYRAQLMGDYRATRRFFAEEVALAERIDDQETLLFALLNLGSAEKDLGHFEAALVQHQQALEIARKHQNRIWIAHVLHSMGEDYHRLGNHQQAQHSFEQALAVFRESGMKAKIDEIETYMRTAAYPIPP
jgi:tetratricopeptide (TPR) repeat protein